jgi:hypothetical protein
MNILVVLAAVLSGLALGAAFAVYLSRQYSARLAADAANNQEAAVKAAVQATLAERGATAQSIQLDRAATVDAAVGRAADVADQKLDARMRLG